MYGISDCEVQVVHERPIEIGAPMLPAYTSNDLQLRYNGWVTEMQDPEKPGTLRCSGSQSGRAAKQYPVARSLTPCLWVLVCNQVKQLTQPQGINNLLYSPDAFFSCFADLALVSPVEYFHEGKGSLMQVVITPAAPYMPWTNEAIAEEADRQVCMQWPLLRLLPPLLLMRMAITASAHECMQL
eukprot:scaffold168770_cov21-Tisochrysis_lutea.AAC.1